MDDIEDDSKINKLKGKKAQEQKALKKFHNKSTYHFV